MLTLIDFVAIKAAVVICSGKSLSEPHCKDCGEEPHCYDQNLIARIVEKRDPPRMYFWIEGTYLL